MKKLKLFLIAAVITGFISAGIASADPIDSKIQSLNLQIKKELIDVLNLPVYLSYCDKNLEGKSKVFLTVDINGKIIILDATGSNKCLNSYLKKKISSRNLWTDTKYKGKIFKYDINYIKST